MIVVVYDGYNATFLADGGGGCCGTVRQNWRCDSLRNGNVFVEVYAYE